MRGFRYRLVALSAVHVGTGTAGGGFDDLAYRDGTGVLAVPAATIKGATRDALNGIVAAASIEDTFGAAERDAGGAVWFSDALAPDWVRPTSRTTVSLTPLRVPLPGALVDIEVVSPLSVSGGEPRRTVFCGEVRLLPGVDSKAGAGYLSLVARGLARITRIGAAGTRGMGRVAVALEPAVRGLLTEDKP